MWKTIRQRMFLTAFSAMLLALSIGQVHASGVKTYRGKFSDGAKYLIHFRQTGMGPWFSTATDMSYQAFRIQP
jgi:hypothetical protein